MQEDLEEKISTARHGLAHVLAKAVKNIYGKENVKLAIGPAIEDGFYYDFDCEELVQEDLGKIEKEMKAIINKNQEFKRIELPRNEALELMKDEPYKTQLINELPENEVISFYYLNDDFVDLCRGPHVENTSKLQNYAFTLTSVNGAYWKGSEKNKMLKRIYALAFPDSKQLADKLQQIEEAKQRDHRKLGKELGIFMMSDLVGKGLPIWLPNGFILRRTLNDYIMNKELALNYKHVMTPSLGSVDLYKTSGHWDHYKDDMFPSMKVDEEEYVLRPMNCPHHMMIYKNSLHSYKDLPLRIAEIANDFRFEASGSLTGIERTRAFTQNDTHIFCTPDQIKSEVKGVVDLILDVYKDFGFKKFTFRLSLRDEENAEKYFGNDELWTKSENELREILTELGVDFYEAKGEAAFYGPKIDVNVLSAIGHEVTLSTVQLDYQLPERFELEYIDENGQKARPVVIHRAILGSLDRFTAFLIEETKGVLPLWLSPVQVKVLNISESSEEYAVSIYNELLKFGIRAELDIRNEKIGYKIRETWAMKVPYMIIVGDGEKDNGTISIRGRGNENQSDLLLSDFISRLNEEIQTKKI